MSLNVGELTAYLRLNDDDFRAALGQAPRQAQQAGSRIESSMRGAERATEGAADQTRGLGRGFNEAGSAATGMGSKLKVAGAAMAGLFAGGALISFFQDSISAASDLNETVNKSNTIFGSAAGAIDKWSDGAAKSLGLSKAAALDAAAGFGNMFTQLGFTEKAAGDMSTQTIQLAADLGSFNNLETDDVVDRLSGAFRGEYDSLQALIPNINAARVETEAMAATGKTSAAALTAQEKATAVLAIVQKDGAKAAGDFAKTSDGLANSQKIVTAQLEDSKARIGQGLLPVWQKLVDLFGQYGVPAIEALGTAFGVLLQALSPVIDILVGAVKAVADLPGPLLVAAAAIGGWLLFGTIAPMVATFAGSVLAAGVAVKGFLISLGPIGIALIAVTTAMAFLMDSTDETAEVTQAAGERWDRLKGTLDGVTGAVTEATRAQLASEAQSSGMLSVLQDLGISTKDYVDASAGVAGAQEKLASGVAAATTKLLAQSGAYQTVAEDLTGAGISQKEFTDALADGDPSEIKAKIDAYAEAQSRLSGNVSTASDIQGRFGAAVSETGGPLSILSGVMNLAGDDASKFGEEADAAAQRALALGTGTEGAAAGVEAVGGAAATAVDPMKNLGTATEDMGKAQDGAATATQFLSAALDEQQGHAISAEQATRLNAAAYRDMEQATRDKGDADVAGAAALAALNEMTAAGTTSGKEFEDATRALTDAQSKSADAADGLFESQVKVRDSALDAAGAAAANQIATGDMEGAARSANAVMDVQRARFMASASAADVVSGAAEETANKLFGIPGEVGTIIAEDGAAAVQAAAGATSTAVGQIPDSHNTDLTVGGSGYADALSFAQTIRDIPSYKEVVVRAIQQGQLVPTAYTGGQAGSILRGFAGGGQLPGRQPSDSTFDNLAGSVNGAPIRLQSEEWIQPVSAVRKYGPAFMRDVQRGLLPVPAGYAEGGQVGWQAGANSAPVVNVEARFFLGAEELDGRTEVIVNGKLAESRSGMRTAGAQR